MGSNGVRRPAIGPQRLPTRSRTGSYKLRRTALRIPRFEPRYDVGDQRNEPPMLRVGPSIVRAGCAPSTGRPQDADRKRAFSAGRSRGLLPAHCLFDQPNDHHQDASSDTAGSDLTDN